MVAQVHNTYNLRNGTVNNIVGKAFGIFIKGITHKMCDRNKPKDQEIFKIKDSKIKMWELKKKVQFQGVEVAKMNTQEKKLNLYIVRQMEEIVVQIY